jgi:hypothetical protein
LLSAHDLPEGVCGATAGTYNYSSYG